MRSSYFVTLALLLILPIAYLEQAAVRPPVPSEGRQPFVYRLGPKEFKPRGRIDLLNINVPQSSRAIQTRYEYRQLHTFRRPSQHDHEQELLCLVKLYVDSFVEHSVSHLGYVDMNDRLIFLVPLIIIYWRSRHPTESVPFREIDGLLREIGDEATAHRQILHELIRKVNEQDHCYRKIVQSNFQNQRDQTKSAETMRIFKSWLGNPDSVVNSLSNFDFDLLNSQSEAREMRLWFHTLAAVSGQPLATSRQLRHKLVGLTDATITTLSPYESVNTNDASVATLTARSSQDAITVPSTTEPFGLPHYAIRATTTRPSHHLVRQQLATQIFEDTSESPSTNVAHVNQLENVQMAL